MGKKAIRWLYSELPDLVSKGILSGENAENLRNYYSEVDMQGRQRTALIVFSILGSFLIGLGIILLIAHNWMHLTRPVRTLLALTPLILSQLLAGWTIWRNKSTAWREGISTLLVLSIGASIALVCQTYHIPNDAANFILTWMLLSVPIVYFMKASFPVIMYLYGITSWAGIVQSEGGYAVLFWPLAALIIPHYWQALKNSLYGIRTIILSWAISICLCIATGIVLEEALPGLWIIVYSGLFVVLYLTGSFWFGEAPSIWQRPFHTIGAMGIFVLSFILTYKSPWEEIGWSYYRSYGKYHGFAAVSDYILAIVLIVSAISLLITCVRRQQSFKLLFGISSIVAVIGYGFSGFGANIVFSTFLFNLYLFILSVGTIASGIRNNRLGVVNAGMIMLMTLIIARFFDSEMSFVIRGIAFIIIGIGFLTTNLILVRRRGGVQ